MKKISIIIFTLIILMVGGYYLFSSSSKQSSENLSTNTIKSTHGFTFTPPEGWKLWEGISASIESNEADLLMSTEIEGTHDLNAVQDFVNKWKPEESRSLVYTRSNVDTKTRDLNILMNKYGMENLENQLTHDNVTIRFNDGGVRMDDEENNTERFERRYVDTEWGKAKYDRIKTWEGGAYHSVTLSIPYNDEHHISLMRKIPKDERDLLPFLLEFLEGLVIYENTP